MLVGAGLMFVLMHGEGSADSKPVVPEHFVFSEEGDHMDQGKFYKNEFGGMKPITRIPMINKIFVDFLPMISGTGFS